LFSNREEEIIGIILKRLKLGENKPKVNLKEGSRATVALPLILGGFAVFDRRLEQYSDTPNCWPIRNCT
jgi:hypothetical protein